MSVSYQLLVNNILERAHWPKLVIHHHLYPTRSVEWLATTWVGNQIVTGSGSTKPFANERLCERIYNLIIIDEVHPWTFVSDERDLVSTPGLFHHPLLPLSQCVNPSKKAKAGGKGKIERRRAAFFSKPFIRRNITECRECNHLNFSKYINEVFIDRYLFEV